MFSLNTKKQSWEEFFILLSLKILKNIENGSDFIELKKKTILHQI